MFRIRSGREEVVKWRRWNKRKDRERGRNDRMNKERVGIGREEEVE